MQKIIPFLWFDTQAAEAARFYVSIFKDAKILDTTFIENTPSGTVEIVTIELFGQQYQMMSAGPFQKINGAISFVVNCNTQQEIDYYWEQLAADPDAGECGWLVDKFGVTWQIVPTIMYEMQSTLDKKKLARVIEAMLTMKKLNIAELQCAANAP
ncbi:MAG: VOC family protein [Sideroxydans sp.]|jgi:predicted 3-demethylubiquinone-9 3-methyltransferase (glyoxalase superfamily)